MSELSYSLHLSSDKNRKPSSKNMAKNNASGSTSLSNNAIQNAKQLSRVDKHNYRKYDNNSELIEIIKGTTSLYEDVKNLYLEEFEEARLEYNKEQENKGRNDRKITDYFKKISDNSSSISPARFLVLSATPVMPIALSSIAFVMAQMESAIPDMEFSKRLVCSWNSSIVLRM